MKKWALARNRLDVVFKLGQAPVTILVGI